MNFFKLSRTKMLDEAVKDHKPQNILTTLLIFYVVYFIGQVISKIILFIPTTIWTLTYDGFIDAMTEYRKNIMAGNKENTEFMTFINEMSLNIPSWLIAVSVISFVGFLIVGIYYCLKYEKRNLASLGIRKKHSLKESLLGIFIGAIMISLTVLIGILSGAVSIKLQSNFDYIILLFLVGFIVQSFSEVVFFFGYLTMSVARDYKISIAISMGVVMFSLLNSNSEDVNYVLLLNTFLFGAILGIYVFKRGDIWGAFGILASWNFIGGNVFGVQNNIKIPSLFVMEQNAEMHLANGANSGIEGGLCTTVVLLIAFGLVFFLKTKKGEESLSDVENFA